MEYSLKEDLKEMNNNMGKSSYAPSILNKWGGGYAPFGGLNDLIINQILIACRTEGKAVNELADEIGVAPVYIEDGLKFPIHCKAIYAKKINRGSRGRCVSRRVQQPNGKDAHTFFFSKKESIKEKRI